jgi:uncharacterized protein (DUF433 family)
MTENWEKRIAISPDILAGKPVIRGTRIAAELIVELLAEGWTEEQILDNYPGLTLKDIQASLAYTSAEL